MNKSQYKKDVIAKTNINTVGINNIIFYRSDHNSFGQNNM